MHIDAIHLYLLRETVDQESVLVRMVSGDQSGWGEASPGRAPVHSPEWTEGVMACLRDWLAPQLVGQDITSGGELQERLARFRGNPMAKGALDMAWWDLTARIAGVPLHQQLGGPAARKLPLAIAVDVQPAVDDLFARLEAVFAGGYALAVLKIRPGWDLEVIRAVRQVFQTDSLAIDCDESLGLDQQDWLLRLDDFHLEWIEQPHPADDLVGHAMLQQNMRVPIALDQSITSLERARLAIDLGSCRAMRLEPSRLGGLTTALAIHNACRAAGVTCFAGGQNGTVIGQRASLALGSLGGFTLPAEWLEGTLAMGDACPALEPHKSEAGRLLLELSQRAGIGISPDLNQLDKLAVEHVILH